MPPKIGCVLENQLHITFYKLNPLKSQHLRIVDIIATESVRYLEVLLDMSYKNYLFSRKKLRRGVYYPPTTCKPIAFLKWIQPYSKYYWYLYRCTKYCEPNQLFLYFISRISFSLYQGKNVMLCWKTWSIGTGTSQVTATFNFIGWYKRRLYYVTLNHKTI